MDNERKTPEKEESISEILKTDRQVCMSNEHCSGICNFPHSHCVWERSMHLVSRNYSTRRLDNLSFSPNRKADMRKVLVDMLRDSNTILKKANSMKEKCELILQEEEN